VFVWPEIPRRAGIIGGWQNITNVCILKWMIFLKDWKEREISNDHDPTKLIWKK